MKLVAYLRVSTDGQAEHGLGLDVQRAAIEAAYGDSVVGWYEDAGESGSNGLDTRAGLVEAMRAARECDGLVVYRLDRLARDLALQEMLLAEIWRAGGSVVSCSESESTYLTNDPADPTRALIRQVLGAVAQYERAMISLRMRAGREHKAANGGYAYGAPPFGYQAVNGELVPVQREMNTIERARELREAGVTWPEVAKTLDRERRRPRHGGKWQERQIRKILARQDVEP